MPPNKPLLGRLEKVDQSTYWEREDINFTPWLAEAENIKLLGDTIGIELEVEAQEKGVGLFRADILCKDTATDRWVLIENQLEGTDHIHLGQLLTYAAGLNAVTIAWIAERFTEEHRAALDWLNEITDEEFNFFGLEIALGRSGFSLCAVASAWDCEAQSYANHEFRAQVLISHQDAKAYYALLEAQKTEIEAEFGEPLIWYNHPDVKSCRVYLRRTANLNAKDKWAEQHQWLVEKLDRLYKVFSHRVKQLSLDSSIDTTISGDPV